MINIRIVRDQSGAVTSFDVNGHANTAPHGLDIVCAAVSALTQTAVLGLERYVKHPLDVQVAKGKLDLALKAPPNSLTSSILETMILGLHEIAAINPQSVRISEHRR